MTYKVEKASTITALQLRNRQLLLSANSQEKSKCFSHPFLLTSKLFTDCQAIFSRGNEEAETLISNNDGTFYDLLTSRPKTFQQFDGKMVLVVATLGSLSLLSVSVCAAWILFCRKSTRFRIKRVLTRIICCICEALNEDDEDEAQDETFDIENAASSTMMSSPASPKNSRSRSASISRSRSRRGSRRAMINRP